MADYPVEHKSPWIDDDGFLRVRTGNERRTREAVEHDLGIAAALTADGPLRTILDVRSAGAINADVWVPLIQKLSSIVIALGVLVSDVTTPQALSFVNQIDALLLPCRVFGEEVDAVAWLNTVGP